MSKVLLVDDDIELSGMLKGTSKNPCYNTKHY